MRKVILVAVSLFLSFTLPAQLRDSFDLDDLQMPNAPGFVLADKAPSAIEKPVTPRTFAVSLYNLREGGALETAPFWWFRQPSYNVVRFLKPVPLLSTLSLSVATFKTDSNTALSAGVRSTFLRVYGTSKKAAMLLLDDHVSQAAACFEMDNEALTMAPDEQLALVGGAAFRQLNANARNKRVEAVVDSLAKLIDSSRRKPVLQASVAGAYLGTSPDNSFENLAAAKAACWINVQYTPANFPLDLLLLGRYTWQIGEVKQGTVDSVYFDYGIGLSYARKTFDASLEYVQRYDKVTKESYDRLVVAVNYQVIKEITLVASFGRNFTEVNNLFTVLGTKIGLSRARVKTGS